MLKVVVATTVCALLGKDITWWIIEALGISTSAMFNVWITATRKYDDVALRIGEGREQDITWGIIEAHGINKSAMVNVWIMATRKNCVEALGIAARRKKDISWEKDFE